MFTNKKALRAKIASLENLVTELRDKAVTAQISESRAQSGYNAQMESERARAEVMMANLRRQIVLLNDELDSDTNIRVIEIESHFSKKLEEEKASFRKNLKADMGDKIATLEKSNVNLQNENGKVKGLYDGALLVIKSLEAQLATANKLNTTLVEAMPTVNTEISGTPQQNVTVNK